MGESTRIDPRAVVAPTAKLGEGVEVGPFAIIGPDVEIGAGTIVGPHAVVTGWTKLGSHNRIFSSRRSAMRRRTKNTPVNPRVWRSAIETCFANT